MKNKVFSSVRSISLICSAFVFFAFPASTGYQLKTYEFGGGGGVGSSSNYSAEGAVGQVAGKTSSSNYKANSGLIFVQQANTPTAPTFQNNGNWYNKLFFILATANNASDATYAIAISDDNWATTKYVQTDNTVGSSFGIANFQSYATWGGGTGGYIIGLSPSITYKIKVKARQGKYTEGPWGPEASATTSGTSLTFDIDISPSDTETSPPYLVDVGSLTSGTVVTASDKIWLDLDTNAQNGGQIFIYDLNNGLKSSLTSYTITSATTNLAVASSGFGLVGASSTQSSGGPLSFVSPYNGSADNVGAVNTTPQLILSSTNPVTAGRASIYVKAKVTAVIPAANDYSDLFTIIAAGAF